MTWHQWNDGNKVNHSNKIFVIICFICFASIGSTPYFRNQTINYNVKCHIIYSQIKHSKWLHWKQIKSNRGFFIVSFLQTGWTTVTDGICCYSSSDVVPTVMYTSVLCGIRSTGFHSQGIQSKRCNDILFPCQRSNIVYANGCNINDSVTEKKFEKTQICTSILYTNF